MEDAENFTDFVAANFDLLADSDDMNQVELDENISPEAIQQVQNIIDEANEQNQSEKDTDDEAFDGPLKPSRHVLASAEKVDQYAHDSHARATHTQSKWAVNVLRGK